MNNGKTIKTISVPQKLFGSMIDAQKKLEEFSNEFEDFLISLDADFLAKMTKARDEHIQGRVRDFKAIKQELA